MSRAHWDPWPTVSEGGKEKQTLSVENRVEYQAWEHMECLTEFVENES